MDKGENMQPSNQEVQLTTVKQKAEPTIKLYPNPAKNKIIIEYENVGKDAKLYILDMMGMLIDVKALPNENGKLELNTEAYPAGIYLASINQTLKRKFVIMK